MSASTDSKNTFKKTHWKPLHAENLETKEPVVVGYDQSPPKSFEASEANGTGKMHLTPTYFLMFLDLF